MLLLTVLLIVRHYLVDCYCYVGCNLMVLTWLGAEDSRERWLNGYADYNGAEWSQPIHKNVLGYWSFTTAERPCASHQRIQVESGIVHRCNA